jgi:hypothetical protein
VFQHPFSSSNIHSILHIFSSCHIPPLALVIRIHSISRTSKGLLNRRPGLRSDIQFRKLRSHLEDIYTRSIENLLRRWYRNGEVCVLGEARDEEHEATGFYLHLGEVGAAGGDVCVPPVRCVSASPISDNGLYVRHALFVGLQYTRYPLKAICEWVGLLGLPRHMRHSQARRPLVQYQLPRIDDLC